MRDFYCTCCKEQADDVGVVAEGGCRGGEGGGLRREKRLLMLLMLFLWVAGCGLWVVGCVCAVQLVCCTE